MERSGQEQNPNCEGLAAQPVSRKEEELTPPEDKHMAVENPGEGSAHGDVGTVNTSASEPGNVAGTSKMERLLTLLKQHPDNEAAVSAALNAVQRTLKRAASRGAAQPGSTPKSAAAGHADTMGDDECNGEAVIGTGNCSVHPNKQSRKESTGGRVQKDPALAGSVASRAPSAQGAKSNRKQGAQSSAPGAQGHPRATPSDVPDMANFLDAYPDCKALVEKVRAQPSNATKTPLSLVNEYASRMMLEVKFSEDGETATGPYIANCWLVDKNGRVIENGRGEGKGRSKRDSRQVAAAACVQNMLKRIPSIEFMAPPKQPSAPRNLKTGLGFGAPGSSGPRKRRDEGGYWGGGSGWYHAGSASSRPLAFRRASAQTSLPPSYNRSAAEVVPPQRSAAAAAAHAYPHSMRSVYGADADAFGMRDMHTGLGMMGGGGGRAGGGLTQKRDYMTAMDTDSHAFYGGGGYADYPAPEDMMPQQNYIMPPSSQAALLGGHAAGAYGQSAAMAAAVSQPFYGAEHSPNMGNQFAPQQLMAAEALFPPAASMAATQPGAAGMASKGEQAMSAWSPWSSAQAPVGQMYKF